MANVSPASNATTVIATDTPLASTGDRSYNRTHPDSLSDGYLADTPRPPVRTAFAAKRNRSSCESCVLKTTVVYEHCIDKSEEIYCIGSLASRAIKMTWGLCGLTARTIGGILSCANSVFCCTGAAITGFCCCGCCCGKETCLGGCTDAMSMLAKENLKKVAMACTEACEDVCFGTANCFCDSCYSHQIINYNDTYYQLLQKKLFSVSAEDRIQLKINKFSQKFVNYSKPYMNFVSALAGSTHYNESCFRSNYITRSTLVLPKSRTVSTQDRNFSHPSKHYLQSPYTQQRRMGISIHTQQAMRPIDSEKSTPHRERKNSKQGLEHTQEKTQKVNSIEPEKDKASATTTPQIEQINSPQAQQAEAPLCTVKQKIVCEEQNFRPQLKITIFPPSNETVIVEVPEDFKPVKKEKPKIYKDSDIIL